MNKIKIADMTISNGKEILSFKEKIEIARHLDNLNVDIIDMPEITNPATDILLVRTISAFIKNSQICVETNLNKQSVENAIMALSNTKNAKIRINIPLSNILMEYTCHKKPNKFLEVIKEILTLASSKCENLELFCQDATRMDKEFFKNLVNLAKEFNVKTLTLCDDEGIMLPDDFVNYISKLKNEVESLSNFELAILCSDNSNMATANTLMAIKNGFTQVKTCTYFGNFANTKVISKILNEYGVKINSSISLKNHELNRIVEQIKWICKVANGEAVKKANVNGNVQDNQAPLNCNDSLETIIVAIKSLGYDLSDEDNSKVYEEFKRIASRKNITYQELDAIVAGVALQVPPTYVLKTYFVNNGNTVTSSSQITLIKNGQEMSGVCMGDGPVDASFKALEQIIGTHYELDDFQIQSITKGREAMGSALVKLRYNGKIYSGNGISTDIIGSSIRAYISAVNKIVYEEN